MLIFYLFIFLFGLIVGSFLNVVVFRQESGEQMVRGRSHCQHCSHVLEWYDLFPIFSFIALAGKCRYCRKKLSIQYPVVEFITGVLFAAVFSVFGGSVADGNFTALISLFYYLFITSILIVIFVYDLKHYIIPDNIIYLAVIVSLVYMVFPVFFNIIDLAINNNLQFSIFSLQSILNFQIIDSLFAAIAASAFFFSIVVVTHGEGMGGGDVKLAFLMGLILGWLKILAALFLAFTIGAICGIIFIMMKKKALKSAIPFGPFLVLGTFVAIFWGEEIVKWYLGYIF